MWPMGGTLITAPRVHRGENSESGLWDASAVRQRHAQPRFQRPGGGGNAVACRKWPGTVPRKLCASPFAVMLHGGPIPLTASMSSMSELGRLAGSLQVVEQQFLALGAKFRNEANFGL